jgi:hypothetical protein
MHSIAVQDTGEVSRHFTSADSGCPGRGKSMIRA